MLSQKCFLAFHTRHTDELKSYVKFPQTGVTSNCRNRFFDIIFKFNVVLPSSFLFYFYLFLVVIKQYINLLLLAAESFNLFTDFEEIHHLSSYHQNI